MKYFIFKNGALVETTSEGYERWMATTGKEYIVPDIEIEKDGFVYSMEMMFNGALDEADGLYPFVLLYFKDKLQLKRDRIKRGSIDHDAEYFETFNALVERREEIIDLFNKGIFPEYKALT